MESQRGKQNIKKRRILFSTQIIDRGGTKGFLRAYKSAYESDKNPVILLTIFTRKK